MTDGAPVVLPPAPPASSESVRRVLQRNRRRDTAPELALRRELHALGLRYLVDASPDGTSRQRRADVVLRGSRIAVLVHGCFWHRCPEHFHAPKANAEWWALKIASVVARDVDNETRLRAAGCFPSSCGSTRTPRTAPPASQPCSARRTAGSSRPPVRG
jgi:DNA mismatch endonuclease, patch repair protein